MDKKYLKEPGTYAVMVIGVGDKPSSKGDPMLTVTFKELQGEGREINSYFVPKYEFMAKNLQKFKMAIGAAIGDKKESFLGKKCLISVRLQQVKPGQEKLNPKTGLPYAPNSEVFEYAPFVDAGEVAKEVFSSQENSNW